MRSGNPSKRKQPHSPPSHRIPTDTSRNDVPRLVESRRLKKMKQDAHIQCTDPDGMPVDGLKGKNKQVINMQVPRNTSTPGPIFSQEKAEGENVSFDSPLNKDDNTDGSDWEDGYIPISGPTDHQPDSLAREVVVEFDHSPSSSKRKPIRRVSAEDKELSELLHKAHLLCLLARGRLVDIACSDLLIQASLLSILPPHFLNIADDPNLSANSLTPLVNWFHDNFHAVNPTSPERSVKSSLCFALENRRGTVEEVVALSVALFRALNLTARFVSVLDVASLKPDANMSGCSSQDATGLGTGIFNSSTLMVTRPRHVSVSPVQSSYQKSGIKDNTTNGSSHREACQIRESSKSGQPKYLTDTAQHNENTLNSSTSMTSNDSSGTGLAKKAEGLKRKGDLEFELQLEMALSASAAGAYDDNLNSELKNLPSGSSNLSSPLNKFKRIKTEESQVSSRGISTAIGSRKIGAPLYWAEVFCHGENLTGKWVHIDAVNAIIDGADKVEAATAACKKSLRYVVAFAGGGAKDVTRRYCMKWYKIASKRINSQWWDAVLAPLTNLESGITGGRVPLDINPEIALDVLEKVREQMPGSVEAFMKEPVQTSNQAQIHGAIEDMELQTRSLTEPLPTNQQAYRNHHLYAIEKWLTKYQILHPKGPILGYCSGYPVYPRTCVQVLQTKQRWLREGLQIKENETPAKMVKRSLKLNKAHASESGTCEEDDREGTFALYGKWQTEPLDLPHAKNGIVPRNERGQVDVWSEKCLPRGTVHLRFPRMVPVAKRLEINFAPAMVGFEFRNGRSIPVYEGIVVCSEFKDAIMEAYAEEEERREDEEKKRNEAQAISRWYQLLSSMITRQRLNETYGDGSTSETPNHLNQKDNTGGVQMNRREDHTMSQSQSQQGYVSKSNPVGFAEDHQHIFPSEDQSFDEESSVRTKRCPCGFVLQVEEL